MNKSEIDLKHTIIFNSSFFTIALFISRLLFVTRTLFFARASFFIIPALLYLLIFVLLTFIPLSYAYANENLRPAKVMVWPFEGVFGTFDRSAAQRGAKVYIEVCATCHGLNNLYYRNLVDLGFSEQEIKSLAANYMVTDGPNSEGEMFQRPATLADRFVNPYPNEEAARAANNSSYPPDLSLIVKARENGANYLFSILTGYDEPIPISFHLAEGLHYNPYFEGMQIAMPKPLNANQVTYDDDTPATLEQMSRDVTIFLQWAAEPEMEHRKSMGIKVMLFLIIFTILFYLSKKRIWSKLG